MTAKVLFVCLGNICRSPTAEGVFRDMANRAGLDVIADGAGTSGWHIGSPPDARAQKEAKRRGYDISGLRGRQVSKADFDDFDLILAMDRSNLTNLKAIRPAGSKADVRLFLDFVPDQPFREVPDPYYDNRFAEVLDLIEQAANGLISNLKN